MYRYPDDAHSRYDEKNTFQVRLKLNYKTDADIRDWLLEQKRNPDSSIQGAIKKLIRKDIAEKQDQ